MAIPSKKLVVYVDDDHDDLWMLEEAFAKHRETVDFMTFNEGREAFEYLAPFRENRELPCLIILDLNMPGLNGKELLSMLRDEEGYRITPIIIFTTSNLSYDEQFVARHNARFMTKPLDYKELHAVVEEFLLHCTDGGTGHDN